MPEKSTRNNDTNIDVQQGASLGLLVLIFHFVRIPIGACIIMWLIVQVRGVTLMTDVSTVAYSAANFSSNWTRSASSFSRIGGRSAGSGWWY